MLTNPKSEVKRKLENLQHHAANVAALEEMRCILELAQQDEGSEHFAWYGPAYSIAISASVKALANLIDSDAYDASELLSEKKAEGKPGPATGAEAA